MIDGFASRAMNKFMVPSLLPANPTKGPSMVVAAVLILCSLLPLCQAQLHSSFFTSAHSCDDLADEVGQLAEAGRLSLARSTAAKIVAEHPDCEKVLARRYVRGADMMLASWSLGRAGSEEACVDKSHVAEPLPVLQVEPQRHLDSLRDRKPHAGDPCWHGNGDLSSAAERWDLCCSGLMNHNSSPARGSRSSAKSDVTCHDEFSGLAFCCDFFDGSASHLRLPALREVALNIRFNITGGDVGTRTCTNSASCTSDSTQSSHRTRIIALEQDGFLRPFDVASILWPAGYLLTLCVASPERYGIAEMRLAIDTAIALGRRDLFAIELGTGIGAPSVALSLYLQRIIEETGEPPVTAHNLPLVLATDTAKHALALAKANAKRNNAQVDISHLDYNNRTELDQIAKTYGQFQVVIGSSLQAFFDGTNDPKAPLWAALDILLDRSNPNAVAIFSHTRSEPIEQPSDASFRLLKRISGDDFNMKTRSGDSSDFELSLFLREFYA